MVFHGFTMVLPWLTMVRNFRQNTMAIRIRSHPFSIVFWSPLDQAAKDDFSLAVLQKSGKDRFLSMWLDIC
jgi:hypothetical protein